jgi:hypothetical protein
MRPTTASSTAGAMYDWAANLLIGRERFVLVRIRMAEAEQGPLRHG